MDAGPDGTGNIGRRWLARPPCWPYLTPNALQPAWPGLPVSVESVAVARSLLLFILSSLSPLLSPLSHLSLSLLPSAVAYKYSAPLLTTRFIQIGSMVDKLVTRSITGVRLSTFSIVALLLAASSVHPWNTQHQTVLALIELCFHLLRHSTIYNPAPGSK